MKDEININLCEGHIRPKYITAYGTVITTVTCAGITYANCRISRVIFNKLLKGECVQGRIKKLPQFTDSFGILYTDAHLFHAKRT